MVFKLLSQLAFVFSFHKPVFTLGDLALFPGSTTRHLGAIQAPLPPPPLPPPPPQGMWQAVMNKVTHLGGKSVRKQKAYPVFADWWARKIYI